MDATEADELIHQVAGLRRRVRSDRRATSLPLFVFGGITLLDALLRSLLDPIGTVLLVLLAPAGFAFVALSSRRREIVLGVGGRTRPYTIAAVVTLVTLPVVFLFGAYELVGVGLLVIALMQRNWYLGVWAVVYGVVGGLEALDAISNRLYGAGEALGFARARDGYFSWSSSLVYGTLGVALIGAALYARRRETAPT
ncbi:MAG TPA: hypothetical protein VN816_06315 [Acidimicrobiales bacterium]|nr:hypothetical protein [Acidimicrobiales bacterium]